MNESSEVNFAKLAQKWQERWEKAQVFTSSRDSAKEKFYCLEMYPYPSGKLHMGHVRNYSLGDVFARYKRMHGLNVLYPMGFDSFGLPAENAAIKHNVHPRKWTDEKMAEMIAQQKSLGLSYDWNRLVYSHDPEYYRWNQWFFTQLFKKGLAYKKTALVNWCPDCNTVLANEQVHDGKCWRHTETEVELKELSQWYLKITDYAEELLNDIDTLEHWPEKVKTMQRNWIGKSEGTLIRFGVVDAQGKKIDEIETFTTRPDTIFGITYLVLAVEHPKCVAWTKGTSHEKAVTDFIREVGKKSLIERTAEGKEKNGVFLGKYIINPVNGKKCPIWTADYALMDYGTGAVMAVPTHDQRDFEFAKKYDLPLQVVINPLDGWELDASKMNRAYVNEGKLVNSGEFDGLLNRDAIVKISEWLETKEWGKRTVTYKLRDWLISRQRYWGTPIPVYYDDEGNPHPIPENELPVILPDDVDFTKGGNPLTTSDSFKYYIDSQTGKKYRRETDTMDTFIDSSWYFLRYTDTTRNSMINVEDAKYWMPVDQYIGGIEHACMHLIYARFFTKVLRDMGLVSCDEPFKRLLTQGMVIKDGAKMSKSIGNVVDPGEIIDKFGPDTARMFILFTALPEKELDWNDKGVEGCYRFLRRVYTLLDYKVSFDDISSMDSSEWSEYDAYVVSLLHRTIGSVSQDMDLFRVSIAIGSLMNFVTKVHEYARNNPNPQILGACIKNIILMLSPVAPHLSEEMWEQCGFKEFCSVASWPEASEKYINGHVESAYEMVERTISDIHSVVKLARVKSVSKLTLFVSPEWKYDFMKIFKESLNETRNVGEIIKRVLPTAPDAHKKDISGLVPRLLKNQSLVPYVVLSAEEEYKALKTYTGLLEKTFNCSISIEYAQGASHAKALSALPGKPSILVE